MSRVRVRKALVYIHRWLGIAGCVVFVSWFASGIVMIYVRMPELPEEERLVRAAPLDLSRATLDPVDAAARHQLNASRLRVVMVEGRPAYRFTTGAGDIIVFADTGLRFSGVGVDAAAAIAQRFAPDQAAMTAHHSLLAPDQWTLQQRNTFPADRFAFDDAGKTQVYVSRSTGDAIMRTTASERFWAWLGPVVHWAYFTPLRRHGTVWSQIVIWSSIIGCILCLSGLIWGWWRLSPSGRFRLKRVPSHSPYAGYMKWHHYAGLLFGVVTLTWTYSGLLSMEPFNWFAPPPLTAAERDAMTGGPLRLELLSLESLRSALRAFSDEFGARAIEAMQVRGVPYWMAVRPLSPGDLPQYRNAALHPRAYRARLDRRFVAAGDAEAVLIRRFSDSVIEGAALNGMPGSSAVDAVWLTEYDGYYYDARGSLSLPVLRVRYDDPAGTWLYFDPERGVIALRLVQSTRLRRWLYHGLHSFDFPGLYYRRPLWDAVVIALSVGGLVLSAASLVPAARRLRRRARIVVMRRARS